MRHGGDVPRGAGLSSSAALEVAVCLALIGLSDAPSPDRLALARLCSRVENEWVGARTGLLDQLASLYGERDRAVRIDFDQRTALLAEAPEVYYITDHYIPYPMVLVRMSRINRDALRDLLRAGWRFVTARKGNASKL